MILGIDTSCYTTSIAFVDEEGRLLQEFRRPLTVAQGERGLRQSEGLFCHVKQLPELMEAAAACPELQGRRLAAVAVSSRPRPAAGSYMPVFLAGESLARSLAAGQQLPLYRFSHQEGHIRAALYSLGLDWTTCGQMGSLAAAYCLETKGPQEHHFTRQEFVQRYREHFDDAGKLDVLLDSKAG
mgnify:CR=1 FL=1